MSDPVIHDFKVYRGNDWSYSYVFSSEAADGTETPTDLNGASILAEAWDFEREHKYASFVITYIDRTAGSFSLALTDDMTVNFPDKLYYDVVLLSTGGIREPYITGEITTKMGYSR